MFIEKLEKQDFEDFVENYLMKGMLSDSTSVVVERYSVTDAQKYKLKISNLVYLDIATKFLHKYSGGYGAVLMLNDYDCKVVRATDPRYNEENPFAKRWRYFVYNKLTEKFGQAEGEKYKSACNEHLTKDYEDGLIR